MDVCNSQIGTLENELAMVRGELTEKCSQLEMLRNDLMVEKERGGREVEEEKGRGRREVEGEIERGRQEVDGVRAEHEREIQQIETKHDQKVSHLIDHRRQPCGFTTPMVQLFHGKLKLVAEEMKIRALE